LNEDWNSIKVAFPVLTRYHHYSRGIQFHAKPSTTANIFLNEHRRGRLSAFWDGIGPSVLWSSFTTYKELPIVYFLWPLLLLWLASGVLTI